MKKSPPEVIELDQADLESKLDQIATAMGEDVARPFRQLLHWYLYLLKLLREKKLSIRRLCKMVFGPATERTADVLSSADQSSDSSEEAGATPATTSETPSTANNSESSAPNDPSDPSDPNDPGARPPRRRRRGHGRIPANQYTGCTQVLVTHESLCPGDDCPECGKGTVYRQAHWSPAVRLKGQPPVGGSVYQCEQLRCHLCGKVYTAALPEEAGPDKYDPSVASIVATLRYGQGMPSNRLQQLQRFAGVPLAASNQWEVVRDAAERGPRVAFEHLARLAAQGELLYNDDTPMQVLELTKKLKHQQPLREDDPDRRGVFTTAILSRAEGRPNIALFFTGPYHAGENLRTLLAGRDGKRPLPMQMCDALSRNMPEDLRVIIANCLVHARRNFVEVVTAFPDEVKHVLECLKIVYKTDADAKQQQLSPEERLQLHQQQSGPVMDALHRWLQERLDKKLVEPNSSLGDAITYMLKHWERLMRFLQVPGAPLDNNLCEQTLKMAIRHRKNSYFYKTTRGADVGDLYMSLIHTCYLSGADPFDYLTELQHNYERVRAAPGDWLPWNYRQQLAATAPGSDADRPPPGETPSTASPSLGA
jgi:transposase